jgi:uncharacterized protein YjaG (DUF416 family)
VDDAALHHRITELVDEEHRLERAHVGQKLSEDEQARLKAVNVELDRTWDLLRRRQARRAAGLPDDGDGERPAGVVEGYLQ